EDAEREERRWSLVEKECGRDETGDAQGADCEDGKPLVRIHSLCSLPLRPCRRREAAKPRAERSLLDEECTTAQQQCHGAGRHDSDAHTNLLHAYLPLASPPSRPLPATWLFRSAQGL